MKFANPMTTDSNLSNPLLANRYQLLKLVGEGVMGRVYCAEDKLLDGLMVAVKLLSQALVNQKMLERFGREAAISTLLGEKSIHIVKVRDYGLDENGIPFYVMEFLQGESLREIIKFHSLSLSKFFTLTRQICLALESAHNGIIFQGELCPIIHRALKPSNIFLTEDPTLGEVVKVLDFGIAELVQSGKSDNQSFIGTLEYCSPEQIQGKKVDNRSDIYSLGVVMYEMLAKKMPFRPETSSFEGWYKAHSQFKPKAFAPNLNVPDELEKLIERCLAKAPRARPQSAGEILQVLEGIEESYCKNRPENSTLKELPQDTPGTPVSSLEEIYLQSSWPKNRPQQKIVFPCLTSRPEGVYVSLWVMLEERDILNRISSIRYNQFLFQSYPHPIVLWITALYNREHGPRWLPCYLDLKTDIGQQVASTLEDSIFYHILFFALNKPEQCQHIMTAKLSLKQRTMLRQWVAVSQALKVSSQPSKKKLKEDFEALKPRILVKLEQASADELHG